MTIKKFLNKFDKEDTISGCNSISSQYDKIIELASLVFCSDKFSDLEKRELHLKIVALYGQLDKKY